MNGYVLTFGYLWVVLSVCLWGLIKEFDSNHLIRSLFQVICAIVLWVPITYIFFGMFYYNVLKGGKKDPKNDSENDKK